MKCKATCPLALAVLLAASACSGFANPDAVSRHVGEVTGVGYVREGGLTVGRTALHLTRLGVAASGGESPQVLESLKDLKVGVYRARLRRSTTADRRRLQAEDLPAYEPLVGLQRPGGEDVLLVSRSSFGRMREMLLVIDDGEDLVVVQVRGDLEQIVEDVVRLAFGRADRPELAAPVLESLAGERAP